MTFTAIPAVNLWPDSATPTVTRWAIEHLPAGLKRWQITRHESGRGYSGVTTWRFAERYQAERYAIDVLGVPAEYIVARGGAA